MSNCKKCGAKLVDGKCPACSIGDAGKFDKHQTPEKNKKKIKSKTVVFIIISLVILLSAVFAGMYFLKNADYKEAIELLNDDKPIKAKEIFEDLGGFKESENYVIECENLIIYNESIEELNEGNYESALTKFEGLGDYKDSVELLQQSRNNIQYDAAIELFNDLKYEEALLEFTELNDFKESKNYAGNCRVILDYEEAVLLMNSGENEAALLIFKEIEEYEDSASLALICGYRVLYDEAEENAKNENFTSAYDILCGINTEAEANNIDIDSIVSYEDFIQLKEECYNYICYDEGVNLYNNGSFYYAYLKFNAAGNILDAEDKALSCIQPFNTEEIYINPSYEENEATIIFRASKDSDNICCKIYTAGTLVSILTIKPGESLSIKLPGGLYSFKYGSGENWFGAEEYFGEKGVYTKTRFDEIYGYPYSIMIIPKLYLTIDLGYSAEGNINSETVYIEYSEFCR